MSKGHDTIGSGRSFTGNRRDINAGMAGNIMGGEKEIKRDPRYNSVSGEAKRTGPSEREGAALVAQVMTRAERGQPNDDQQNRDRTGPGIKFRTGGNHARRNGRD